MVFCNVDYSEFEGNLEDCHNPYFSRWFSAITLKKIVTLVKNMSQSLF